MQILEQFIQEGFEELLIVVGNEPRVKKLGRWMNLKNQTVMLSDWGKLIQAVLSEKQKSDLDVLGYVSGQLIQKNNTYFYSFFQRADLFKFSLTKKMILSDDIILHPRLIDYLNKPSALSIFCGQKDSKIHFLVEQCLKQSNKENMQNILILNEAHHELISSTGLQVINARLEREEDLRADGLFDGVQCVVFVQPKESTFPIILNLLEGGTKVYVILTAKTIINSIQKILSHFPSDRNAQLRMIEQMDAVVFQQCYQNDCFIHEIVFLNDVLKQMIQEQKWPDFEQFLAQVNDHPNLISFNQSLLQLILKRKIDLRKSFEITRYPTQLDVILKKVGV